MSGHNAIDVTSKLPGIGTSIFTVVSQQARAAGAINLAQGFPDLPVDAELIERISWYMKQGHNQYAPSDGVISLRERIADMTTELYGYRPDAMTDITITSGATEALYDTFAALVSHGDEVIILEPAYDAYVPNILINGGKPVPVRMYEPDFHINWDEVSAAVTVRTKAIIINNPHNPTGSTLSKEDLVELSKIVLKHDLLLISDEVYHNLIYDGKSHQSVLSFPELRDRSVVIFSFGKTFHATGWKVGYTIASSQITQEIRKVHQFVTFAVHTPTQLGIADHLTVDNVQRINLPFQRRRDLLVEGLKDTKFTCRPASGTYFQVAEYRGFSPFDDRKVVDDLILNHGIALIPLSPFYLDAHQSYHLRFCFAKQDETLNQAIKTLQVL